MGIILSTDHFFGATKEEYKANWSYEKLTQAHQWCQNTTRQTMEISFPCIIIDNTNVTQKDMKPYLDLAAEYGYQVRFEQPTSSWWQEIVGYLHDKNANQTQIESAAQMLADKNKDTHGVPAKTILNMLNRFQINVVL